MICPDFSIYEGLICPDFSICREVIMLNIIDLTDLDTEIKIDKDIKSYVIDPYTKEQVNVIKKGDKIVRKASIDSFKDLKNQLKEAGCEKWQMSEFYKANTEETQLVSNELSTSERAFLFSIAPYVSFEDNHLQIGRGKKAVDIGTEDLINITGMSRSTLYETINLLASKDIIYRGINSRNRQYFVNPWLFCKGNMINKVLKTMFKNYKVRSKGNIPWKDLEGF